MPSAVHLLGHIWAIDPDAALRYTPSSAPAWRAAPPLPARALTLVACPSRTAVLVACADGSLHAFHPATAALQASSPAPLHDRPLCLYAHPAENALFAGLADGAVVRLHLPTLAFDCMLGCGVEHSAAVHALHADRDYLYSAGADAVVLVWDLSNAAAVREISMPSAPVRSLLRVSHSLWLGLADGSVEVLDIFGDDTNSITRIAHARPHALPVTALVPVGDTHVWSVAEFPAHADLALPAAPNVAVWDRRDASFSVPDDLPHPFLHAVTVLEEHPYDRVTMLTLTPQLEPHFHIETVPATRNVQEDVENEALVAYVHDLEQQLDHATEELHFLRAASLLTQSDPEARPTVASRDASPASPVEPTASPPLQTAPSSLVVRSPDLRTPSEQVLTSGALPVIPAPVMSHLEATLTTLAELLVTLLTDDVLASDSDNGSKSAANNPLRHAVAALTQELNAAKSLLDSCATPAPSESDHQAPTSSNLGAPSAASAPMITMSEMDSSLVHDLRERLDAEMDKSRKLEQDLELVTRERDLGVQDLTEVKKQSDLTLTSLQAVIRENTSALIEKDDLIGTLRAENEIAEDKWCAERVMREEMESSVKERVDKLMHTATETSKEFEVQLRTAYDKIENKSIEVQAQRESLQATEGKLDELRSVNRQLEQACGDLQARLQHSNENSENAINALETEREQAGERFASLTEDKENLQIENLDLQKQVRELSETKREVEQRLASSTAELSSMTHETQSEQRTLEHTTNQHIEATRREASNLRMLLEKERTETAHLSRSHEQEVWQLRAEIREMQGSSVRKGEHGDEAKLVREQADKEIRSLRERSEATISEMTAKLKGMSMQLAKMDSSEHSSEGGNHSSLSEQYRALSQECELLKEEVEHRKSAVLLYEEDSANMSTIISNLRAAAEELKDSLEGRDEEVRVLVTKVDEMKAAMSMRERRIEQLQTRIDKMVSSENKSATPNVEANGKATRALLASAHGEIEQMSNQMDSMYRAQLGQEKELTALRKALTDREETIRRRDAALDALRRSISEGLRARATEHHHQHQHHAAGQFMGSSGGIGTAAASGLRKDWSPGEAESGGDPGATGRGDDDAQINATLQELQEGMVVTQDKLRNLTQLARKCKALAHSHVEVLPALFELEGELGRLARHEPRKGHTLKNARGIVQSVIAQYYCERERRAVMSEAEDAAMYRPSDKRMAALQASVARMRGVRLGEMGREASEGGRRGRGAGSGLLSEKVGRLADRLSPAHHSSLVDGRAGAAAAANAAAGGAGTAAATPTPTKRLLTF